MSHLRFIPAKVTLLAAFMVLPFWGCGDDSSNSNSDTQGTYEGNLPPCEIYESEDNSFWFQELEDTTLVCDAKNGTWKDFSTLAEWAAGRPCIDESKEHEINDTLKIVCDNGIWRVETELEIKLDNVCFKKDEGATDDLYTKVEGNESLVPVYYMCTGGEWKVVSEIEYKSGLCTDERDGDVFTESVEIYDSIAQKTVSVPFSICENGEWRPADTLDVVLDLGCTDRFDGVKKEYSISRRTDGKDPYCEDENYYICKDSHWRLRTTSEMPHPEECLDTCFVERFDGFHVCVPHSKADYYNWITVPTEDLAYDILYHGECDSKRDGKIILGRYQCLDGQFVKIDSVENQLQGKCTKEREAEVKAILTGSSGKIEYLTCHDGTWQIATDIEILNELYSCDDNEGEFMTYSRNEDDETPVTSLNGYICENGSWRELKENEKYTKKLCNEKNESVVNNGYICDGGEWRKATDAEEYCGGCSSKKYNETCSPTADTTYICEDKSWRIASGAESSYGLCLDSINGVVEIDYDAEVSGFFICKSGSWEKAASADDVRDGTCRTESDTWYFVDQEFICQGGTWKDVPSSGD